MCVDTNVKCTADYTVFVLCAFVCYHEWRTEKSAYFRIVDDSKGLRPGCVPDLKSNWKQRCQLKTNFESTLCSFEIFADFLPSEHFYSCGKEFVLLWVTVATFLWRETTQLPAPLPNAALVRDFLPCSPPALSDRSPLTLTTPLTLPHSPHSLSFMQVNDFIHLSDFVRTDGRAKRFKAESGKRAREQKRIDKEKRWGGCRGRIH